MVYLSEASVRKVLNRADELVQAGWDDVFWAEALRSVLPEISLRGLDVAGLPWVEIDSPYDLDRARKETWPEIEARMGTRVTVRRRRKQFQLGLAALGLVIVFGLGGLAAWWIASAPSPEVWEPIPSPNGRRVEIVVSQVPQEWVEARGTEKASTKVEGPRKLRIDVRALTPGKDPVPYVVEVGMDGSRLDWHKFTARPNKKIAYPDAKVCDKDKIELDVPEGEHAYTVHLVSGDVIGFLARFRVLEPAGEY
jgi:hypothetical protein